MPLNLKMKKIIINKLYLNKILFYLFTFFLPSQLGKHFFLNFSYLNGIRVDYLAPTVYFLDLLVFLIFLLNFKDFFRFFFKSKIYLIFLLFFVNLFFAKNIFLGLLNIFRWFEFFLIFFFALQIYPKINKEKFLLTLFFSTVIQSFLFFYQLIFQQSFQGPFYFLGERLFSSSTLGIAKVSFFDKQMLRPYGSFSHPNSLAGFYLLFYFFILKDKKNKNFFILKNILLLLFSFLIFFSFSKLAIFTFFLLNFYYFLFDKKISCKICQISRLLIIFVFSLIFLNTTTDPLTFAKRKELVLNSFSIIVNNLFGVGLGNYLIEQNKYFSSLPFFYHQPVHNIFLLYLSEIGVLIFFASFYLLKKFFLKLKKENLYLLAVVLITGFFDHYWLTLIQNFFLLAFVYGSVSSCFLIERLSSKR